MAGLPAAVMAHTAATDAEAPAGDDVFQRAMHEHAQGHWARAWDALAPLADAGHRLAARQALRMAMLGLGPDGWVREVGPGRLARWETVASSAPLEPVPPPGRHGC